MKDLKDSLKLKPFEKTPDKVMKPSEENDAEIMTTKVPNINTKCENQEKSEKDEKPEIKKILTQEDDRKATTKPGTYEVHENSHGC